MIIEFAPSVGERFRYAGGVMMMMWCLGAIYGRIAMVTKLTRFPEHHHHHDGGGGCSDGGATQQVASLQATLEPAYSAS